LVHTENGLKPISEIKVGDKVLSYDERTETTSYQPVMAVIQGEQRYQLISITLDSGESIEATAEHPFYIKGKGWNPASSLKVGQALQLHNGTTVVVKEIDTSVRLEKVYNFTVANTHNYFVGGDGVLVHNCKKVSPHDLHRTHSISGRTSSRNVNRIAESLMEEGWIGDPIDVIEHEGKMYIVDGHHRLAAAKRVGVDVPVRLINDIASHQSSYKTVVEVIESAIQTGPDRLRPPKFRHQ